MKNKKLIITVPLWLVISFLGLRISNSKELSKIYGEAYDNRAYSIELGNFKSNDPPNCFKAEALPEKAWRADQQFHQVEISGIYDPNGDELQIKILGIFQNEPVQGLFFGDRGPDAIIEPLSVKAERWERGSGRSYRIRFKAIDSKGGICIGEVMVCVPLQENLDCWNQSSFSESYISTDEEPSNSSSISYGNRGLKDFNQEVSFSYNENILEENEDDENDEEFLNKPPKCSKAYASVEEIYPADGFFHSIEILGINEPENDLIRVKIDEVIQDEPLDISSDGRIEPSAYYFINDEGEFTGTIKLKAKIGINQDQRAYFIHFTAFDSEGAACSGVIKVCILSGDKEECKKCKKDKVKADKHCDMQQGYDAMFEGIVDPSGYCGCTSEDCIYCKNHGYPTADDCCSFKAHRTTYDVRERYCYRGADEGAGCEEATANFLKGSNCNEEDICNITDWTCWKNDPGCWFPCYVKLLCPVPPIICEGSSNSHVCAENEWCVGEWSSYNTSSGWVEWDKVATARASSGFRPFDCDCTNISAGTYASSSVKSYQGNFYGNPSFVSIQQSVDDAGHTWHRGWQWSQKVERGYYCAKLIQLKGNLVCQKLGILKNLPDIYRNGTEGNPDFDPRNINCAPWGCKCP